MTIQLFFYLFSISIIDHCLHPSSPFSLTPIVWSASRANEWNLSHCEKQSDHICIEYFNFKSGRDGFFGWMGIGGSVMQWHPALTIGTGSPIILARSAQTSSTCWVDKSYVTLPCRHRFDLSGGIRKFWAHTALTGNEIRDANDVFA